MTTHKPWSKLVTAHGVRIRLFERGNAIYREVRGVDGRADSKDRKSLRHRDRDRAVREAKELARAIAEAQVTGTYTDGRLTLGQLFAAYRRHRLPAHTKARAREAEARIAMFSEAWTTSLPVSDIDATRVRIYCAKRRGLEVVAPGLRPDENGERRRGYREPKPARDGALDGEFRWLNSVLNWACGFRQGGKPLLATNPLPRGAAQRRALGWPVERNPRRPIAAHQRFEATREHVDVVDPAGRLGCILALARWTGRRESAICQLQAHDLLLSADRIRDALAAAGMDERLVEHMPHGGIRWAAESDKQGFLFISPISRPVREALERYLRRQPRVGDVPLFPAPRDPEKALRRETAARWLVRAEGLAELPKLRGGVFHPYRRLWATERKSFNARDVASAGGWRDDQALRLIYQHADPESVLRAVEHGAD